MAAGCEIPAGSRRSRRDSGRLEIGRDLRAVGFLQDLVGQHQALGPGDRAELADLPERQADKGLAVVEAERLPDELEIGARILDGGEFERRACRTCSAIS